MTTLREFISNMELSNNVYLFSCEFSKDGHVDYRIKVILWENLKSEPLNAVVNFFKLKSFMWLDGQ